MLILSYETINFSNRNEFFKDVIKSTHLFYWKFLVTRTFIHFCSFGLQIALVLVDFVVENNLAFNVTQSPSLQQLLERVSGRRIVIPSRKKVMSTLDDEYSKMKVELKELLSEQKYICLTADVWSSRAQSYLGVTVHFINQTTFLRESYVLAFKQIYFKQTYNELGKAIQEIMDDFGITKNQVTNIVTDGGSAFGKMFKMFGSH